MFFKKRKGMNFKQAVKKLDKIAVGRFNTIEYKITQYSKNSFRTQECTIYLEGYSHFSGPSWSEAFDKLDKVLSPKKITEKDIDPIPELIVKKD